MADTSAQRTMMVDTQIRPSDVTKFPIIDAMLSVAREDFVPPSSRQTAYADAPIAIAAGRSMLEPRTLAKMLDALDLQQSELALNIGAGLGYTAAIVARMCEAVIAVEEDEALAQDAQTQLAAAEIDNVAIIADALTAGAAKHGPYDVVLIDAAVEFVPQAILDQLKDSGRIAAIFAAGSLGVCRIGFKDNGSVTWRDAFNASADFLPGFQREDAFVL